MAGGYVWRVLVIYRGEGGGDVWWKLCAGKGGSVVE